MKYPNAIHWLALAGIGAALAAGCKPSADGQDDHDHAGHSHGPASSTLAAAGSGESSSGGKAFCAEHGVPEAECGVCRPETAATLQPGEGLKVRLPSTNSAALVGIQTAPAETGPIVEAVECVAELSFDQNKLAEIAAPVGGIIQSVEVDLGSRVREKQPVASIWSASIAEAVARAVLSHQTLERERRLRAERVTSQAALDQAEATHRAACQQLRTLGFTEEQIDQLGERPQEKVLMEVRAPFAGEIVERMAVRGALVEAGRPLFTLADRSTMWAMLQVPETALDRVRTGQSVELRVDALPGRAFRGKLTWIGPAVDPRTRLVRARAEFANPEGLLKDKMFATARILTRQEQTALVVPAPAVQHVAGRPFVFVKLADDLFEARAVRPGAKAGGRQEIQAGLQAGEPVAIERAFALKSALLLSRLGAGCADD